ncbi:MAG: hypothetical protein VKM34_04135 [Cyanobacteriota bacterium]|nr:hypothetical protein [Cyanobacteriota bacterium]
MATATDTEAARNALREFIAVERRRFDTDPEWIACRADARAVGLRPGAVYSFKQRHGLPRDQRLSPDARALLALELETAQRVAKGHQLERAQALALIAQRATPEAAADVAALVPCSAQFSRAGIWCWQSRVEAYLLNRVEALTGKAYATAGSAWQRAAALAPTAAPAAAELERFRRILFWGVVLRLDQLEGPPPAEPAAFYRWSQLEAYSGHDRPIPSLGDVLAGRMGEEQARQLLALPVSGPLSPDAIRSAYRAQARQHHPDAGGDRQRFEQLSTARDRLLLGVA